MRILWSVNTIFPFPAKELGMKNTVLGGWLISSFNSLLKEEKISSIAIVSVYQGKEYLKYTDGKVIYYLIPCINKEKYDKKLSSMFKMVYDDFKPDLIHIHGTEYPYSLSAIEGSNNIKTIVSIQGLVSVCGIDYYYNAGISKKEMLKNITLRDIIRNDLLINQSSGFKKRGKYEKKVLKKCDYIIGRTSWDRAYAYSITNDFKYKKCNESLRESFYNSSWNITKIEKHSIFISQATYPIKGFHILLKSASILKNIYPDLKIYVAGNDIIKSKANSVVDKLKLTGYGKYILNLIKKYELNNNIEFLGLLNEDEMCNALKKCNVFVQASSIENSPNSLGEAMLLGMPCVASYVGGTGDMLLDKKEGFLYPFGDYSMLAYYISNIFDNDDLAIELGKNAKKHALITHNRNKNCDVLIEIYMEALNEDKE